MSFRGDLRLNRPGRFLDFRIVRTRYKHLLLLKSFLLTADPIKYSYELHDRNARYMETGLKNTDATEILMTFWMKDNLVWCL